MSHILGEVDQLEEKDNNYLRHYLEGQYQLGGPIGKINRDCAVLPPEIKKET